MIYVNENTKITSDGIFIAINNEDIIRIESIFHVSRIYGFAGLSYFKVLVGNKELEIRIFADLINPTFIQSLFNTKKYKEIIQHNIDLDKKTLKTINDIRDEFINIIIEG